MVEFKKKDDISDSLKDDSLELTFEEAIASLGECAQRIGAQNISLADAIKSYEDGMKYYERCQNILENAKQKIDFYSKAEKG